MQMLWETMLNQKTWSFTAKRRLAEMERGRTYLKPYFQNDRLVCPPAHWHLSSTSKETITSKIKLLQFPAGFRLVDPCTSSKNMNAADWLALMAFAPFLLSGLLPDEVYRAVVDLFTLLVLVSSCSHSASVLDDMKRRLDEAVARVELVFPLHVRTITLHMCTELVKFVRLNGPFYGSDYKLFCIFLHFEFIVDYFLSFICILLCWLPSIYVETITIFF